MERLYIAAKKMYKCIDRCDFKGFGEILEENISHDDDDSRLIEYLACYLFNKYIEDNPETLENSEIIEMREKYDGLHKFKSQREYISPFKCDERFFAVRYFAGKLLHLIFQRDKSAYTLLKMLISVDIVDFDTDKMSGLKKVFVLKDYIEPNLHFLENIICTAVKYENTGIMEGMIDFAGRGHKTNDNDIVKTRVDFCVCYYLHYLQKNDNAELLETFGLDYSSDPDLLANAYIIIARRKYNIFRFYKQLFIRYRGADAKQAEKKAEEKLRRELKDRWFSLRDIVE